MKKEGFVKWFNDAKGYGFITPESGADLYVHFTAIIREGFRTLKEGEKVRFLVVKGRKGDEAHEVEVIR
jgi:cold shock protein